MRAYYEKSAPYLAGASSRNAMGEADSLLTSIEYAANSIADLLYAVVGPIFWLAIIWALVSTFGVD